MQMELIPRRRYGSGRVDTVFGPRRRRFPALGGPSWSRLCPGAVRVLSLPVAARLLSRKGLVTPSGTSHFETD